MSALSRFVWFLAKKVVVITVALAILVCAFWMCMNTTNVYVVLDEGMEKRVDAIMGQYDVYQLGTWFHADFLSADPALAGKVNGTSVYSAYNIASYDYELKISSIWAWPWDQYATCTVVERVTGIEGTVKASRSGEVSGDPPAWQSGKYNVTLVRTDGKWKIIGLQQTAVMMDTEEAAG